MASDLIRSDEFFVPLNALRGRSISHFLGAVAHALPARLHTHASAQDGVRINNVDAIQRDGMDTREVAGLLSRVFCEMTFTSGFVHCDPHPGLGLVSDAQHVALEVVAECRSACCFMWPTRCSVSDVDMVVDQLPRGCGHASTRACVVRERSGAAQTTGFAMVVQNDCATAGSPRSWLVSEAHKQCLPINYVSLAVFSP